MLGKVKGLPIKNYRRVTTRNYYFINGKGEPIVIQEHSYGHKKAVPLHGAEPHFNVRSAIRIEKDHVEGTHGHYNF